MFDPTEMVCSVEEKVESSLRDRSTESRNRPQLG